MSTDINDISTAPVDDERKYTPAPGEAQLTVRAVIVGCMIGSLVSCTNLYIALKIGWSFGASILTAVLGFAFFSLIGRRLTVLETNTAQTAGSAAGYMSTAAGFVAAMPALDMLATEAANATLAEGETAAQIVHVLTWPEMTMWAVCVAFLGVFYAVPLRRQFVLIDKLRFPTGSATAETILAMFSKAEEALAKARVLILFGVIAAVFKLSAYFIQPLEEPPIHEWLGIGPLAVAATWTFRLNLGPSLLGAGFLIGPRVVLSLVGGAILAWGILAPMAQTNGWAPGDVLDFKNGPRGWILWPGVALMVSEALTSLALSWPTFVRALRVPKSLDSATNIEDSGYIPNSWWIGGLIAGSTLTTVLAHHVFDIPWYLTLVAIALSAVLAIVATRSLGETDINPVGGVGKVTQLVFGGLAPGQMQTNLMAAAITGGGASQAADMMQDLKTGYLLGAAPRKQFLAQLCGILAGIVFAAPAYLLLTSEYELGGRELPAPAALAWKAMAELLAEGPKALPPNVTPAVVTACLGGVLFSLLRRKKSIAPYTPSGLAMGIAFIITADTSLLIFYGMVIWWVWKKISPASVERYNFAVASGLIAGEGLMGFVNAGMKWAEIQPLIEL